MTPRERMIAAVTHQQPDKAPKDIGLTQGLKEEMIRQTGSADVETFFEMEARNVTFRPPNGFNDFSAYKEGLPEDTYVSNEYGAMQIRGSFHHFTRFMFPMRNIQTMDELERYPWPDITPDFRHSHLEEEVQRIKDQGYCATAFAGHIFENSWQLLGFERFFEEMVNEPDMVEFILQKITDDNCFRARRYAEAGVDIIMFGDDVGMQDRLMMSPSQYRKFLKPKLAAEIKAARDVNPTIPVWYHSDGVIDPILDDLVEVGVTILNPVQPECVDIQAISKRYKGILSYWGTIGTQTVMPFGKPADVKKAVKDMIETFGPALVVAPTHVLEPDVPWENIIALKEAIEEFGQYK